MQNTTDAAPQKKLLYEVSIIRPIVIFLLVLLHSLTKITNGGVKLMIINCLLDINGSLGLFRDFE